LTQIAAATSDCRRINLSLGHRFNPPGNWNRLAITAPLDPRRCYTFDQVFVLFTYFY